MENDYPKDYFPPSLSLSFCYLLTVFYMRQDYSVCYVRKGEDELYILLSPQVPFYALVGFSMSILDKLTTHLQFKIM